MSNAKLFLTFIFSVVGAILVVSSVLDEDKSHSFVTSAVVISSPSDRSIASDATVENRHENLDIDVDCKSKIERLVSRQRLVQLHGKVCALPGATGKPRQILAITNKTNQVTASVFSLDANHFETDLISLSKGENEFEITVGSGSRPRNSGSDAGLDSSAGHSLNKFELKIQVD